MKLMLFQNLVLLVSFVAVVFFCSITCMGHVVRASYNSALWAGTVSSTWYA